MPASASAGRSLKKATHRADRVLYPLGSLRRFFGAQGNDQRRGHLHIAQIMRRASADGSPTGLLRINSQRYVDVAPREGPDRPLRSTPSGASEILSP